MDKCQKIVVPLGKGKEPYQCTKVHYKDGWCFMHYPDHIAAKKEDEELRKREYKAERLRKLSEIESPQLTIENAIVLLVKNGYRVELSHVTLNPCLPQE